MIILYCQVWDGFQWVDKAPVVAPDALADAVNTFNETGLHAGLGAQKDSEYILGSCAA